MINKVKLKINNLKGKEMYFKYKGSRNQVDEFIGFIDNTYSNVFTIKLKDSDVVKSYSYNDVLIHKLVFKSV